MYEVESHERETFDFEAGGQEFHVTKYRCLPLDVAMRMGIAQRDRDGMAVTQTICELFEAEAPGCTGLMTIGGFRDLMLAWFRDSGMAEGESVPSSE